MNTLGKLEQLLMNGEITDEEYKERKEVYVETILEMYVTGIITKEELYKKLNEWTCKKYLQDEITKKEGDWRKISATFFVLLFSF